MKKRLFYALFLFVSSIKGQNYFYQYFENNFGANTLTITIHPNPTNIWQIGKPQKTMFNSASSLPNVIVTDTLHKYPKNNTSVFSFTFVNQFQSPFPTAVQWKQKLNMDAKKDGGIIEFSTNSGAIWQNAHNNTNVYQFYGFLPANKDTLNSADYCFSGTDTTWRDIWLCLPYSVVNQNDSILFRFTFKSDSINTGKEGWMIDNIILHQTIVHPVKEISQIDNIVVYPNVTSGILNIEMKKISEKDLIQNIQLYNDLGKLVENYGQNYSKVVLDISKYKPGIYYLKVTINKKVKTFKVLYEKN